MKLNVPLVRQKKGSKDCGPACLAMVLKYYGINKTIDEIKRKMKVYKKGTRATQLGTYLLENGFSVELITQNPGLFTRRDRIKPFSELRKQIREFVKQPKAKKHKKALDYYEEFFEKGGTLKVKIPDAKDIEKEINQKRPLIALMTSNFLLGKEPKFNFHYNVVTGIDGKNISANDPSSTYKGGKKKYPIEDYLYGVYASSYGDLNNASFLKIKKLR